MNNLFSKQDSTNGYLRLLLFVTAAARDNAATAVARDNAVAAAAHDNAATAMEHENAATPAERDNAGGTSKRFGYHIGMSSKFSVPSLNELLFNLFQCKGSFVNS